MTSDLLAPLASRLLVFTGDQGLSARAVQRSVESLTDAEVIVFNNYESFLYSDIVADFTDKISSVMRGFLERVNSVEHHMSASKSDEAGEVAGITYRIQGAGPPLVLLPLGLARSQWGPIVPYLADKFCLITLGGAHLGSIRDLEIRARTGFKSIVRNLMEELDIADGESVLDVGCGSGANARDLANRTGGNNPITAVDYSPYMIAEAKSIARSQGMEEVINFREGDAEALPFPESSFDVVFSVTVMEEVNSNQMMAELVRVVKRGGRIGVIVRANDSSWVVNLPISDSIKRKVEPPGTMGGGAVEGGCADRSLYSRFVQAGLNRINASAQLATFGEGPLTLRFEAQVLGVLSSEEAEEWREAAAQTKAEGTFFIAMPLHCAVGTKPG
jgi:SAM-dependent methyltransferase